MKQADITFHQASEIGSKLPFALVEKETLVANEHLFAPSIRDFHVIFWLRKGSASYAVDFETYHLPENSIVMVSKDSLHYFEPLAAGVDLISIPFVPEFLYRTMDDLGHLAHFETGSHVQGLQILQVTKEDVHVLDGLVQQMADIYRNWMGKAQSNAFYHLLNVFLIKCAQMQADLPGSAMPASRKEALVYQFNTLLNQHFKTHFDVAFYVDRLGTSVKALSRALHARYTLSTKSVIDKRRILEIKRLLIGSELSIKEIAYDLGFDEPTNMVKFFKKHVGETPLHFRTQHK